MTKISTRELDSREEQGMGRPPITEDQREIAITMLANALRKDAHLRNRAKDAKKSASVLASATASKRVEPSKRYVEGMQDLLRVMFAEGPQLADELMEEAYAMAMGMPSTLGNGNGSGASFH